MKHKNFYEFNIPTAGRQDLALEKIICNIFGFLVLAKWKYKHVKRDTYLDITRELKSVEYESDVADALETFLKCIE